MLFNIYYLNFSKVYEIKMIISNLIHTGGNIETGEAGTTDAEIKASMGAKFLNFFNADVGSTLKSLSSDSQKVIETFEVKTTKSIILNDVIKKSKSTIAFQDIREGALIRVDNVKLELLNEQELRTVKIFSSGALKGSSIPQIEGLDLNNALNSILKDYSYKLKGISQSEEQILIKIPMTFESELESLYSIDDLFIGNVTIIGIYKGQVKIDKLKNSFDFFQELGQTSNSNRDPEVHNSQLQTRKPSLFQQTAPDETNYHYIDLLAIVQNIDPVEVTAEEEPNRNRKKVTKANG
ncbi:hypothetical protein [Brevibacillus invocatus]|uniref:hypothetical protein n=1 Tax=Brevibacillus invocatus TaxID=173959 RepID=UPI00203D96CB|nr:hypothetical protein [Brevibacillus invocatus]MCM3432593.1 hypothetical protein [Brevibacillus invocatus]